MDLKIDDLLEKVCPSPIVITPLGGFGWMESRLMGVLAKGEQRGIGPGVCSVERTENLGPLQQGQLDLTSPAFVVFKLTLQLFAKRR